MKEKETKAEAAVEKTDEKKFELREGDVTLFKNTKPKNDDDYQLWGRAVIPGGQTKFIRLWKEKSNRTGQEYFRGYTLDELASFNDLKRPEDDKHESFTIIFHNDQYEPEAEKKRPIYTGKLKDGQETFRISLWNKQGAKGVFYSGKIDFEQQSEGTEDLTEEKTT